MVRDRLHLQRMLLRMVCSDNLIKDDEGAISIARREYQTLSIRGPGHVSVSLLEERERSLPGHIGKFIVVQLRKQTQRACLLCIVDRHRIHGRHRKQHAIRKRKNGPRLHGCCA